MSGSDKTRARRNAKVRAQKEQDKAVVRDLADLQDAMGDTMPEEAIAAGHTLFTAQEVNERAAEEEKRIGKSAAQLLAEAVAEQASAFANKAHGPAPLAIFKQADGTLRVVGWSSNNRRDRDNPPQILTDGAHKEFMAYLDANRSRAPEFWLWHTPGTRYAKADVWDYVDGFTMFSAPVDAGKELIAQKAAEGEPGMSHGFYPLQYDPAAELITQYRTFEVSALPRTRAANPYTSFNVIRKEAGMAFTPEKRSYLVEKMGEPAVAELERNASDMKAAADAAGIESKDLPAEETAAVVTVAEAVAVHEAVASAIKESVTAPAADAKPVAPAAAPANPALDPAIAAEIRGIIADELSKMGKEIGDVKAAVKTVAERVVSVEEKAESAAAAAVTAQEQAAASQKSLDEEVAEILSPRRSKMGRGFRPSAAAETKIVKAPTTKDADLVIEEPHLPAAPNEWWLKEVIEPIMQKAG